LRSKVGIPITKNAERIAARLGAHPLWEDWQVDTYFETPQGKLKLRESGLKGAELIPYLKAEEGGTKRSDYVCIPVVDPALTKGLLSQLLGVRCRVAKRRKVFLLGNVRIHLDEVEQLGRFLEFEAVFDDKTQEELPEHVRVKELLVEFGIAEEDLIRGSYPELLIQN
jgi:adenylate cyclase, class 2